MGESVIPGLLGRPDPEAVSDAIAALTVGRTADVSGLSDAEFALLAAGRGP